jgi:hypothetical protein
MALAADDQDALSQQAERLRASGALGRPGVLQQLFDFLLEATRAGSRPKEVEIALAVFGKAAAFDGGQDATVRVYVHRLRKKLEAHYAGPGRDEPVRLAIPKGEYRLAVQPVETPATPTRRATPGRGFWIAALALVLALNAAAWGAWRWSEGGAPARAGRTAPWSQLLRQDRPLILVLGDYYIFGDIDQATGAGRLIREYAVNGRDDLDGYLMDHPQSVGRYRDLDLFYLPVSTAAALRDIMPVLAPRTGRRDDVRVVMASDLTPEMLRRDNIVYIGYLSGLSVLREPVFAGSRFRVGDTWDELIDTRTGTSYASQEGGPDTQNSQRDYGYFSSFRGPTGNHIVIVAGARDVGLTQIAEAVADPRALRALVKRAGGADAFEALYEAEGLRRASLGGRLIEASPLKADRIWAPQREHIDFPAG